MQFDPTFYNNILQAANVFLNMNLRSVGEQFARGFMAEYTPSAMNQVTQQNAQHMFDLVATEIMRQNGGQAVVNSDQQLFDVVGMYITETFKRAQSRNMQNNNGGFGGGQTRSMFGNLQNSQSGFGGGQGMQFGNRQPGASSHLGGDEPVPAAQTAPASTAKPITFTAPTPTVTYAASPLDDIPDTGIDFVANEKAASWNGGIPKDNRIVMGTRVDFKTKDERFAVNAAICHHQQILNDPMQVLRDFYEVAPESVLGSVFQYTINYVHLDILSVPTQDFIDLRNACISAVQENKDTALHLLLLDKLKTMRHESYENVSKYLVVHINRALHVACRIADKPDWFVKISELKDVEILLSSQFNGKVVHQPNGRYQLETIVGNAIWNALVKNASVMFEDDENIPTNAIQSSPAFPFSLDGVYPNKYAIPTSQDADKQSFLDNLRQHVLSRKTYLLSRRRVVITNVLGKKILPELSKTPKMISTPLATVIMTPFTTLPFVDPRQKADGKHLEITPNAIEDYPSDQLLTFQEDPKGNLEREVERFRGNAAQLPVDQTIFTVQYGMSPEKYLGAIDIFTTVDGEKRPTSVILGKRDVKALHVTDKPE